MTLRGFLITKDRLLFAMLIFITYEVTLSQPHAAHPKNPCPPGDHLCNQIFGLKLETLGLIGQLHAKFPDLANAENVHGGGTAGVSGGDVQHHPSNAKIENGDSKITTKVSPSPTDEQPSAGGTTESGNVEMNETLTTVAVESDQGATPVSVTSPHDVDRNTSADVQMATSTSKSSFADKGYEKKPATNYSASPVKSKMQSVTSSLPESTSKLPEPSGTKKPEIRLTTHSFGNMTTRNKSEMSISAFKPSDTDKDQSSPKVNMTTTKLAIEKAHSATAAAKQTTLHPTTSTSSPSPSSNVEEDDSTDGPMLLTSTAPSDDVTTSHTAPSISPSYSVINISGDLDLSPNETIVEGHWTAPYEDITEGSADDFIGDETTESSWLLERSSSVNVRDATTRRALESIASSPSQHPASPDEEDATSPSIRAIGSTLRDVITSLMTIIEDEQELSTMESADEEEYDIYYEGTTVEYVTDELETTHHPEISPSFSDIAISKVVATSTDKVATTAQPVVAMPEEDVLTSQDVVNTTGKDVTSSEPVVTTTEEEFATFQPDVATIEIDVALSQSVVTTTEQEVATSQPVVTTTEQEVATSQPVVDTTDEDVAFSQSVVTTTEMEVATSQPVVATTEKDIASSQSVVTTTEQEVATSQPIVTTLEIAMATSQPVVTTTIKDVASSQPVVTTTTETEVTTSQPVVSTTTAEAEEPSTSRTVPSTEEDIQPTTAQEYVTTSQRPASTTVKDETTSVTTTEVDVTTTPATTTLPPPPKDCHDIWLTGERESGIYRVYPAAIPGGFEVFCDLSGNDGGWTVIQRRVNGSVNFYRSYFDYEIGFGTLEREFYLGNRYIHALTSQEKYQLSVILFDHDGESRFANYKFFKVGDFSSNYQLQIKGYSGNAGNSLGYHSKSEFSTFDRDNDVNPAENCARTFASGWWFRDCNLKSNLNGQYLRGLHTQKGRGITWKKWKGLDYSLKFTEMKIKPVGL